MLGWMKRAVLGAIPPAVFLALTAYFGWNAMRGEHGLKAYAEREKLLVEKQQGLAAAQAEFEAAEKRAAGLRASHIDADALDERARAMLNLADPNDIVVPYGPGKSLY